MTKTKHKFKTLTDPEEVKKLIFLLSDKCGCGVQFNSSPCNTCFHAVMRNVDTNHILWLVLLGLRGDYDSKDILGDIKEELEK